MAEVIDERISKAVDRMFNYSWLSMGTIAVVWLVYKHFWAHG